MCVLLRVSSLFVETRTAFVLSIRFGILLQKSANNDEWKKEELETARSGTKHPQQTENRDVTQESNTETVRWRTQEPEHEAVRSESQSSYFKELLQKRKNMR